MSSNKSEDSFDYKINDALDNISHSIENASDYQNKRQQAEELKNQYYQNEINRLKEDLISDSKYSDDEQLDLSDYRRKRGNLDSDLKDDKEQSNAFQPIDDEEYERNNSSEFQDPYPIQSVYNKTNKSKDPDPKLDLPQQINVVKRTSTKFAKPISTKHNDQKKTPQENKTLKDQDFGYKNDQTLQPKIKIAPQKPLKCSILVDSQTVMPNLKGKVQPKQNTNQGYLRNVYDSDLALEHMKKQNELQLKTNTVKSQIGEQLLTKKNTKPTQVQKYHPRGVRDLAEINLFGHPQPCRECAIYFSQGLSSDNCSYHGKQIKEIPPSQQVPKRFAKFL